MTAEITRIVTVHRQWEHVARWIGDDALFEPRVAWILVNDDPLSLPAPGLADQIASRGIRRIDLPRNCGRSAARNEGARLAATPWIEHVDGDDHPLPFPLADLATGPDVSLLFFPVRERSDESSPPDTAPISPGGYWDFLCPACSPFDQRPASTAWRREAFLSLLGYDARWEPSEDLHLCWQATRLGLRAGHPHTPKQCYLAHAATSFRAQRDHHGSFRFFRWLLPQLSGTQQRQVALLLGRQWIAAHLQSIREGAAARREIAAYLWARTTGRFRHFNRPS